MVYVIVRTGRFSTYTSQHWRHIWSKKDGVCLKFKLNWAPCIFSGNPGKYNVREIMAMASFLSFHILPNKPNEKVCQNARKHW